MTSLASSPEFVVPNRTARLTFTLTDPAANFVRVWVTSAPPGSDLRGKLDKARSGRVEVFESDGGPSNPWETKFDVGGAYTFVAQEYLVSGAGSKGYERAPGVAPLETKLPVASPSETTLTLYVGQRMTSPVGTPADAATLVLWVWNATIRPTTLETHGEASPNIVSASPTPKIRAAMEATAVRTAVAALANVTATAALGNISTIVSDLVTKTRAHTALAIGIHAIGDSDNRVPEQFGSTMAPKDLPTYVNTALRYMRQHHENMDTTGVYGAGGYHDPSGSALKTDFANMPILDSVGGLPEAYAALAELWRCHEGHRAVPSEWHGTPTSGAYDAATYTLTTLPVLLQVHLRVFEVLASFNSATPPTQTTGAMFLIEQAGFAEG